MEVVVARRKVSDEPSDGSRQPERGASKKSVKRNTAVRISTKLHDVPALWIRACNGVSRALWFGNFQHGPAHFALDTNDFRAGGFGCIAQRSADVGRPAE